MRTRNKRERDRDLGWWTFWLITTHNLSCNDELLYDDMEVYRKIKHSWLIRVGIGMMLSRLVLNRLIMAFPSRYGQSQIVRTSEIGVLNDQLLIEPRASLANSSDSMSIELLDHCIPSSFSRCVFRWPFRVWIVIIMTLQPSFRGSGLWHLAFILVSLNIRVILN